MYLQLYNCVQRQRTAQCDDANQSTSRGKTSVHGSEHRQDLDSSCFNYLQFHIYIISAPSSVTNTVYICTFAHVLSLAQPRRNQLFAADKNSTVKRFHLNILSYRRQVEMQSQSYPETSHLVTNVTA